MGSEMCIRDRFVGGFKTFGWGNFVGAGIQFATFTVAAMIQREQDFRGELAALFQHLINDIDIDLSMLG